MPPARFPRDRLCGLCLPNIVVGNYGEIVLHLMHTHGLRYKEAKEKTVRRKENAPRDRQ